MGIEVYKKHLREKRAIMLSLNSGYTTDTIAALAKIGQETHASAINIRCDKKIYETARKNTKLPIFATSIHPYKLLDAVKWGVDGIIIGNFEKFFTKNEIYNIVLETLGLINNFEIYTCVALPKYLKSDERNELIKKFSILGVELFQYEGLDQENLNEIYQYTYMPIMTTLDKKNQNTYTLMNSGANALNYIPNENDTVAAIKTKMLSLVASVSHKNSLHREIARSYREFSLI